MNKSLRFFDVVLKLLTVGLALASLASLVAVASLATKSGAVGTDARLAPGYTLTLPDGRSATVRDDGEVDGDLPIESAEVRVTARVGDDDNDTRVASGIALCVLIAAAWVGVINLRRIVRTATDGDPFDERNVARLRRLAVLALATPVAVNIYGRVLEQTLDAGPPIQATAATPGTAACVIVGVGLLALAEVFREGVALRELEQSTV